MSYSMQVVVISHGFFPRIGGAERLVASVSPLIQKRGVGVYILTRRLPGTQSYEVFDGVPVFRLPVPGPKPLASLIFTLAALWLILRIKPDLIHAHELISPATTALVAKGICRCPVLATVHRSGPPGDIMRMNSRPLGKLRLRMLRKYIDKFVVISREIDRELAQEGVPPDKRVAIPNGVDVTKYKPVAPAERQLLRQKLGLPLGGKQAIFAGRFTVEKRVSSLVEIWPSVQASFPGASLVILGSGPEEATLKQKARQVGAENGIIWCGPQDQVVAYLQAADLFILPSVAEGLSVALLEAMACGLPSIATAVGGAPEVVTHGQNGWLIPADDQEALRSAILELFADEPGCQRLGQNARQHILDHYSLEMIADQLCSLYGSITSRGGPA